MRYIVLYLRCKFTVYNSRAFRAVAVRANAVLLCRKFPLAESGRYPPRESKNLMCC